MTFIVSASAYTDPNGSFDAADRNPPTTPGEYPSTINPAYDYDYHRFVVAQPGFLSISTIDSDLYLYKYLFDYKHRWFGTTSESEMLMHVNPGTYYQLTRAFWPGTTGNYTLKFNFYPSLDSSIGFYRPDIQDVTLPYSDTILFSYDKLRQCYRFELTEPGVISVLENREFTENTSEWGYAIYAENSAHSEKGIKCKKTGDTIVRDYYRLDAGTYVFVYTAKRLLADDSTVNSGFYPVQVEFDSEPEEPLFPNAEAFQLADNRKFSYWFGYFDDSEFPVIDHCVLGSVTYEYANGEHILYSDRWGKLVIVKSSIIPEHSVNKDGYILQNNLEVFSERMMAVYTVTQTTDDCVVLQDDAFYGPRFHNEGSVWSSSMGPEVDDVVSFYNWAFDYVVATQVAGGDVRNNLNNIDQSAAYMALGIVGEKRSMAINHCLNTLNAIQLREDIDQEFWRDAVQRLIDTADSTLQTVQTEYVNTFYGNP